MLLVLKDGWYLNVTNENRLIAISTQVYILL